MDGIVVQPSEPGEIVVIAENPTLVQEIEREEVLAHNRNWKKGPVRRWNNRPRRFLARKLPDGSYRDQISGEILDLDLTKCKIES